MKTSNTEDIYGLNYKIFKLAGPLIIPQLTRVVNLCFAEGIFPQSLKLTKVIPIFKSGSRDDKNNYRPIAIQPIFSKIIEQILKKRLVKFFEKNDLFCLRQYGYIRRKSTIDALIEAVENIAASFDQSKQCSATCLDLSKAFDCVSHDILIKKLEYYGIRGIPLKLFKSYLTGRSQIVELNNNKSKDRSVCHGVVQGSVMGAIFFVIYVNDLVPNVPSSTFLYADDTTILNIANTRDNLDTTSKISLKKAQDWFQSNRLKLNIEKTQNLVFDIRAPEKNQIKLLGVYVDNSLSWEHEVTVMCKRLCSVTFQIRRILQLVDVSTAKLIYYSNFQSVVNYSILLWGSSGSALRVFVCQKRVIRVLFKLSQKESCKPLFVREKILTVPCLFLYKCFVYVRENCNKFQRMEDIHSYGTRNKSDLLIPYHRLATSQKTVGYQAIKVFNSLKSDIKALPLNKFKICVKRFLEENAFYSVEEYLSYQQAIND